MSLATIQKQLKQLWNTNIYRIGLMSDSIWTPTGAVVESDGSHPYCGLKVNCFGRMLYDYLDFNKPTFRSIEHSDWSFTGGEEESIAYYGLTAIDKVRVIDNTDTAEITITGKSTVVFWFEGGYSGETIDTGVVNIQVDEGDGYVSPSETSLLGRKTPVREGNSEIHEDIIDSFDTNIDYPGSAYSPPASNSAYTSHIEIQYNNLDESKSYTFKIAATSGVIRLGGCFYFSGKTCVIQYAAVPGYNWDSLRKIIHARIAINDFQLVLAQTLIYHDFFSEEEIEAYAKAFYWQLLRHRMTVMLVTCTPGGGVIEDSATTLGDEEPSYVKGQNFMKEFNNRRGYIIPATTWGDYPVRDDVYSVSIGGDTYNLRSIVPRCAEVNFDTFSYRRKLVFEFPSGCPIDDLELPATATRVSGSGAASFELSSVGYMPPAFSDHIEIMNRVADYFGIGVIDLYQYFADLAVANGETTETTPYPITEGSPLYSSYPDGYENYLSRYFRPNHWNLLANEPSYEKIRDGVFLDFDFKHAFVTDQTTTQETIYLKDAQGNNILDAQGNPIPVGDQI